MYRNFSLQPLPYSHGSSCFPVSTCCPVSHSMLSLLTHYPSLPLSLLPISLYPSPPSPLPPSPPPLLPSPSPPQDPTLQGFFSLCEQMERRSGPLDTQLQSALEVRGHCRIHMSSTLTPPPSLYLAVSLLSGAGSAAAVPASSADSALPPPLHLLQGYGAAQGRGGQVSPCDVM